jgi:hypothetical protein
MSCLGLGRPGEPFHAGLAIRRNALIAAMAEGLVLVASGLKGGSSYAVRWALERGLPIWCFECGRATPPANRHLIRIGRAEPLPLGESPGEWSERVLARMGGPLNAPAPRAAADQLDWLAGAR